MHQYTFYLCKLMTNQNRYYYSKQNSICYSILNNNILSKAYLTVGPGGPGGPGICEEELNVYWIK